ncbi:SPOR domain-containing protein [Bacillus marasmi]|uniref:SPOR domain-containing protein n=1 Tax=Bacillus marasmi TaxID=1926279 RepID=UPI00164DAE80|nr:SPOR domain-containing protein [Bacillus marasmi]
MEKREHGKTITIKINGKHQAFDKNQQKVECIENRQGQVIKKSDSEMKSIETDTKQVEEVLQKKEKTNVPQTSPMKEQEIVNQTSLEKEETIVTQTSPKKESSATEQSKEDQFDWILPERSPESVFQEFKEIPDTKKSPLKPSKLKKSSSKWFSGKTKINRGIFATIFFAVFLAVILGTSFGLTMLKLVFIEKPMESETAQPVTAIPQEQQATTEKTGGVVYTLPTISTWVIQESAYSNSEAAKSVVDEIKGKGISASIYEGEKSFILIGVADSKDSAKALGVKLTDSGIEDPFSKELSAGGKELKGINKDEKAFLEKLPSLFSAMTKCASSGTIVDSDQQKVNEYAKQLEKNSKIENKQIKSLLAHSEAAIKNINSIAKKSDKKQSNELQQHLLTILSDYQALK